MTASRGRARIVLITGEPGSGKSTLGATLAGALRVPFIARDDVRGGLFFTEGSWTDAPGELPSSDEAVETLLSMVETAAGLGVSLVVEYVVRRGRPQDLDRLTSVADCVVLVTSSVDARQRFVRRSLDDPLLNRRPVLDALGYVSIDEHTIDAAARMDAIIAEMRTEFDVPTMHVATEEGYVPDLDRIVEFVTNAG